MTKPTTQDALEAWAREAGIADHFVKAALGENISIEQAHALLADLVNAPSGLPQEPAPDPAAFAQYLSQVREARERAEAAEEAQDELEHFEIWLHHCAREYARAKKIRRTDRARFIRAAAELSRACTEYLKIS